MWKSSTLCNHMMCVKVPSIPYDVWKSSTLNFPDDRRKPNFCPIAIISTVTVFPCFKLSTSHYTVGQTVCPGAKFVTGHVANMDILFVHVHVQKPTTWTKHHKSIVTWTKLICMDFINAPYQNPRIKMEPL